MVGQILMYGFLVPRMRSLASFKEHRSNPILVRDLDMVNPGSIFRQIFMARAAKIKHRDVASVGDQDEALVVNIVVVQLHVSCNRVVRKRFPLRVGIGDFLRSVVLDSVPHLVSNFSHFELRRTISVIFRVLKVEVLQVEVVLALLDVDTEVVG